MSFDINCQSDPKIQRYASTIFVATDLIIVCLPQLCNQQYTDKTKRQKRDMIPPSSISSSAPVPEASSLPTRRGAFFLLEGVDRCGKTTQCARLVQRLVAAGLAATAMRFPDRSTATGAIINNYLQQTDMALDDRAIHLLFSANRWESAGALASHLRAGVSVVCDRYAYSGVAFSAAKINPVTGKAVLDMEWCQAPDRGLPAPDCVIFLDLSLDEAEQRGGYVLYLTRKPNMERF